MPFRPAASWTTSATTPPCWRCRGPRRSSCSSALRTDRSRSSPHRRSPGDRSCVAGVDCTVARTGYTGELGVELIAPAADAERLWDALTEAGAAALRPRRARHAAPRGLLPAARQRHRAGHERDRGRPRLGLRARPRVHRLGRAGAARASTGPAHRLVAFRMLERAIPRAGCEILDDERTRRRPRDQRNDVAEPRRGHRHGLRAERARRAGHRLS